MRDPANPTDYTATDRELRGTPLVGRGRSSAIPGTAPLPALLAKEARGKLVLTFRDPLPAPEPHGRFRASRLGKRTAFSQRHI